jgi:type II secretory pathway pseudopilin PulG
MKKKGAGFTLAEVIISVAIITGVLVGLLSLSLYCLDLQETANNTTIALNEARKKIEDLKSQYFNSLIPAGQNSQEQILDLKTDLKLKLEGKMRVELEYAKNIDNTYNRNLIDLRLLVCWKQRGGRVIGEDKNLNGRLDTDTGEDQNGNEKLDSPVEIVTAISNKR